MGNVTMSISRAMDLIFKGDLDESDFEFDCPICGCKNIEWSGLTYWYCYSCDKKIFKEDFFEEKLNCIEQEELKQSLGVKE